MKRLLLATVCALSLFSLCGQQLPVVKRVVLDNDNRQRFVRVAQFQIDIPLSDAGDGNALDCLVADRAAHIATIGRCLDIAARHKADIVLFPELTLHLPAAERAALIDSMRSFCRTYDALVVGGTFYGDDRRCRCAVVDADTVVYGYKLSPSIFESSAVAGGAMEPTDTLTLFCSRFGNFVPVVCVDMISDRTNYLVRELSNGGQVDMVFNCCYNPASREFLREASAIVQRHRLFVSVVNVAGGGQYSSESPDDNSYGFSGIVGQIHPLHRARLTRDLPQRFRTAKSNADGYENLVAVSEPAKCEALIYELNLRVVNVPHQTNAPDQGYPTIRNIEHIPIP